MLTATLPVCPASSYGFDGLIDFLRDLKIGASTLATQAHVHRNTINKALAIKLMHLSSGARGW